MEIPFPHADMNTLSDWRERNGLRRKTGNAAIDVLIIEARRRTFVRVYLCSAAGLLGLALAIRVALAIYS